MPWTLINLSCLDAKCARNMIESIMALTAFEAMPLMVCQLQKLLQSYTFCSAFCCDSLFCVQTFFVKRMSEWICVFVCSTVSVFCLRNRESTKTVGLGLCQIQIAWQQYSACKNLCRTWLDFKCQCTTGTIICTFLLLTVETCSTRLSKFDLRKCMF